MRVQRSGRALPPLGAVATAAVAALALLALLCVAEAEAQGISPLGDCARTCAAGGRLVRREGFHQEYRGHCPDLRMAARAGAVLQQAPEYAAMAEEPPQFAACCRAHQACYEECGEVSKGECDERLHVCLDDVCNDVSLFSGGRDQQEACALQVRLLDATNVLLGCPLFAATQEQACECLGGR